MSVEKPCKLCDQNRRSKQLFYELAYDRYSNDYLRKPDEAEAPPEVVNRRKPSLRRQRKNKYSNSSRIRKRIRNGYSHSDYSSPRYRGGATGYSRYRGPTGLKSAVRYNGYSSHPSHYRDTGYSSHPSLTGYYGGLSNRYGGSGSAGGSHYGALSGSRRSSSCCPLVIDPLTVFALLASIAAGTFFLNNLISANITPMGIPPRRRREAASSLLSKQMQDLVFKGN